MLFAQVIVGAIKHMALVRISTKLDVPLEAAVMMRVLSLPASFFSSWQSGDLATRVNVVGDIARQLQDILLTAVLNSAFSLVYIAQISNIAPSLAMPALLVTAATTAVTIIVALAQVRVVRKRLDLAMQLNGWQLALISGVQKIRLAGAEKRAFSTWADIYQREARLTYNGPWIVRLASTIQTLVSLGGTMLIYGAALAGGVTVAQYMAFSSAYGSVSAAFAALAGAAVQIANIRPYLNLAEPLLKTVPEGLGAQAPRRASVLEASSSTT